MTGRCSERYYTPDEVQAQLDALSEADWVRLVALARLRCRELPDRSPQDFLQEACLRVLEGDRGWPRDLAAAPFFMQVLRSLVSDYWKGRARESAHADVRSASEFGDEVIEAAADPLETPEQAHVAAQALEAFAATLDPEARDLLEWQRAGYSKQEIQADWDLDDTAYDTLTRRIRRAVAAYNPEA